MKSADKYLEGQPCKIQDLKRINIINNKVLLIMDFSSTDAVTAWAILTAVGFKCTIFPVFPAFNSLSLAVIEDA